MSNFFEQELRKLFGDERIIDDPTYSGRACFGILGSDLRMRAQFVTTGYADHYDSLRITVLNRTGGTVDTLTLKLKDLLGMKPVPGNPNFPGGVAPYIWVDRGQPEWYAFRPTVTDYQTIQQAVEQYLDVFRERPQERASEHIQTGPKMVYICVPFQNDAALDIANNITFARQKAQEVLWAGDIPICPRLMFLTVADLGDPELSQTAREISLRLLESCQQIKVCGSELTEDMLAEISHAAKLGIPTIPEQTAPAPSKKRSQKRRDAR